MNSVKVLSIFLLLVLCVNYSQSVDLKCDRTDSKNVVTECNQSCINDGVNNQLFFELLFNI
jgi:hypothetical protein